MIDYQAIDAHHLDQFGDVSMIGRLAKLTEEAGEVAAAVVRDHERRDGKRWHDSLILELGDLWLVTAHMTCKALRDADWDITPEQVFVIAQERFLARSWDIRTGGTNDVDVP